jgi:hypothetical protein
MIKNGQDLKRHMKFHLNLLIKTPKQLKDILILKRYLQETGAAETCPIQHTSPKMRTFKTLTPLTYVKNSCAYRMKTIFNPNIINTALYLFNITNSSRKIGDVLSTYNILILH